VGEGWGGVSREFSLQNITDLAQPNFSEYCH